MILIRCEQSGHISPQHVSLPPTRYVLHIRPPQLIKQGTGAKRAKGKRACWKHYHNLQRLSFRWAPLLFPTLFALTLGRVCVCVFTIIRCRAARRYEKYCRGGAIFNTRCLAFLYFFSPLFFFFLSRLPAEVLFHVLTGHLYAPPSLPPPSSFIHFHPIIHRRLLLLLLNSALICKKKKDRPQR